MSDAHADGQPDRRSVLRGAIAIGLLPLSDTAARATPEELQIAIRSIAAGASVTPGRVKLDLPALADSGNGVPLTISVDSPMTDANHVCEIHILSQANPSARIATLQLGPRAGRAKVSTSIRLASSQAITAIARMSDGSLWSGQANVVVTATACIEDQL